jgi:glycosyltransferase involved in cell wall biosynthesis
MSGSVSTVVLDTPEQQTFLYSSDVLKKSGVALLAPRICFLGEEVCGGSEVVLREDVAILRDAGIPTRVYGHAARQGSGVKLIPIHAGVPLLGSLEYCGRFLREERSGLVVAYNEPAVAGWAPKRSIVRFDWATPLPRYWNWPGWRSRFQKGLYLFPSESERQLFLREHPGIPVENAQVLLNAVDVNLFRPKAASARTNGPMRVGYAGQWVPRKGVAQLLEAWKAVKAEMPSAELHLAGGAKLWKNSDANRQGEPIAASVQQMEEQHLLHRVGVVPRAQMPHFWNSVDIAVVPSLYEPFGLVAVEALACGVPVVASAVGGLQEIVEDGKSGILVPPGDAGAIARALRELLNDQELRSHLSQGARRRAEEFSLERRSRNFLTLLSQRAEAAKLAK